MSVATPSMEGNAATEHHHHPEVRHQFDDLEQQHTTYSLGMWAFIVQEVMFFSGMIVSYFIFRYSFPEAFIAGSNHLSVPISTVNTIVLLSSSLTMALAVHAAQIGNKNKLIGFMIATLALGSVFLGIKGYEYYEKYDDHLIPGYNFEWPAEGEAAAAEGNGTEAEAHAPEPETIAEEPHIAETTSGAPINYAEFPTQVEIFYGLYFITTGFHALHMVIGAIVIITLMVLAWYDWFPPEYYVPIEMFGLYWHFVDIVWVFLFPLLYLIDRAAGGH